MYAANPPPSLCPSNETYPAEDEIHFHQDYLIGVQICQWLMLSQHSPSLSVISQTHKLAVLVVRDLLESIKPLEKGETYDLHKNTAEGHRFERRLMFNNSHGSVEGRVGRPAANAKPHFSG